MIYAVLLSGGSEPAMVDSIWTEQSSAVRRCEELVRDGCSAPFWAEWQPDVIPSGALN